MAHAVAPAPGRLACVMRIAYGVGQRLGRRQPRYRPISRVYAGAPMPSRARLFRFCITMIQIGCEALRIQRMKKKKLVLKDKLSKLEDQIIPDIIA